MLNAGHWGYSQDSLYPGVTSYHEQLIHTKNAKLRLDAQHMHRQFDLNFLM